jgi:anti-anti-sigma factor
MVFSQPAKTTHPTAVSDSMSSLAYETYGDVLIATFNGAITRRNAPSYQEELSAAFESARSIVVDLTEIDDVPEAGFRMLLQLYHQASCRGGEIALVGLNRDLRATVDATGFSEFFVLCETLDEAIERLCYESAGHASLR